jgi:hypothetical protein
MSTFPATQQTQINMFKPAIDQNQTILCKLPPAKFDALVKTLNVFDQQTPISVVDSKIEQSINNGTAILSCDITDIAGKINIDILTPKKHIKLMKSIKGNNDVFIIDDTVNKRFVITNGDIKIFLPKQIENFKPSSISNIPDLSSISLMGQTIIIDKDIKNIISSLIDTDHVDLLIYGNQLKGINVPDTAIYSFPQYVNEKIDDTTAELKLRSFSFLKVDGEDYQISLGNINSIYWLATVVNTGIINVNILETITAVSDETLLI